VLYVDYGNKEKVKVTQLRTLPDEFKTLPMQAICCALAEVITKKFGDIKFMPVT
jgi:tudor domain-containing protein 1/4/6/7